jgi:nicotinate-nucleotide adenylyltransferase
MTKIALFGTSADPPTTGHQKILAWLSEHFDWVAVWASDNPFKSHQTPLEHRATMLRLTIQEIASPRHNIALDMELSHGRTLETVKVARQKWPDAQLVLGIGSDLIAQLPQWYRVEALLNQVDLLVVPRPGYAIDPAGLQQLRDLGATVSVADLGAPAVSSTAYRERQQSEALSAAIEAYIHREKLYACQDAS